MASVFAHAAAAAALGSVARPTRAVVLTCVALSVLPDLDVLAFSLGIPYEHPLGHRGLTHALAFAAIVGPLVAFTVFRRDPQRVRLALLFALATASHGILDAMTTGGLGVGFWIPFASERFFFPFRPIAVSPIGIEPFLGARGLAVLMNEALWVGLPSIGLAGGAWLWRRRSPAREDALNANETTA